MIQSSMNAQSHDHHWKFVHVEDKYYHILPSHPQNEKFHLRIVRSIEDESSFQLALYDEYSSDSLSDEKKVFEQKLQQFYFVPLAPQSNLMMKKYVYYQFDHLVPLAISSDSQ